MKKGMRFMRGFMHRFGHRFRHRPGFGAEEKRVTLSWMQNGQSGVVVEILGRRRMVDHLYALGVRPGKRITKVSSMFMRGPVTVQVDRTQVAIGFGMARRIIVELD